VPDPIHTIEYREKQGAALSSLIAAVGLTSFKIIVGLATGSLGILAEAAHSGLDLVAAVLTLFAVRFSGRPADHGHLLLTCGWIVWKAIQRLRFHDTEIEVTWWSFAALLTSIVVDFSRSRLLSRTARKYHSQALEADALHFQTDVWTSGVVIFGLISVKASQWYPRLAFLRNGDAVAALGVSLLVVWVSWQLGRRTVDGLLDSAPPGMEERIAAAVSAVPGVQNCHNIRLRYSGPVLFIDLHVLVDGQQTLLEAHRLTETIEGVIQQMAPKADVTVHPEPY
jgi:cation diffusion facilitator family transporter